MKTAADKATSRPGPADGVLVDPAWLAAHLHDPGVRVVEVDVSPAAYNDWHIDGAALWDIYADVKDADYRTVDAAALERLVARTGIGPESTVIFCGYAPALALWLMKVYGHSDARILDCSRDTWRAQGHPWSTAASELPAGSYRLGEEDRGIRADRALVRDAINLPGTMLVDVRGAAEFRGDCFWPSGGMEPGGRAGHVPSAVHQLVDGVYNADGSFRSPAELRRMFAPALLDGRELITYCTTGGVPPLPGSCSPTCSGMTASGYTTGPGPSGAVFLTRLPRLACRPAYCQGIGGSLATVRPVRIQICGALAIERDGQRLDAGLPGREGRLLCTYLVVNRHRHVSRDELAQAMWREPDPAAVDARLNPLLSKLRRVFGTDAVDGRSTVRLCLPDAWVDLEAAAEAIHRAESAVAQQDWARAWGPALTALFVAERDFLPGEDAVWIDGIRHQLTELRVRALEAYAAAGLGLGGTELAAAVRAGQQLTRLAPLRESGYRYLMQALAAQNNLAEAISAYSELSDRLRDQLGVSPGHPPALRPAPRRDLSNPPLSSRAERRNHAWSSYTIPSRKSGSSIGPSYPSMRCRACYRRLRPQPLGAGLVTL